MGLPNVAFGTILQRQEVFFFQLLGTVPTIANGSAVAATTIALPRNGVVKSQFAVTLRVSRAEWFAAADVAQVRAAGPVTAGSITVVVDFGVARTVSAVAATSTFIGITSVQRWLGASFEPTSLATRSALPAPDVFASEVKTERLLVTCTASSLEAARAALAVQLPETPSDLELRIDGGPPVWTSAGPVVEGQLGSETPPLRLAPGAPGNGATRWTLTQSANAPVTLQQRVDLGPLIDALLGDADAAQGDTREVTIALSSRVPGAIGLDMPTDLSSRFLHVTRVTDGFVDGRKDVVFATEGVAVVPLTLPSWAARVHSATCTLVATCDASRALPPVGPDATMLEPAETRGGVAQADAEFVIDASRSLALRVAPGHGLQVLSAVRMPLRPDRAGCELRAVLADSTGDPSGPGQPLDGGTGKPVTVDALPNDAEQWITLDLQSPFTLPTDDEVFVALHVIRGSVALAAKRVTGSSVPPGTAAVWRGAPTGPWEAVPDSADLAGLRGRIRLVGTAPNDRSIPPARLALGRSPDAADGVTPSPKGVKVLLESSRTGGGQLTGGSATGRTTALHLVALTPCSLSVRDVIIAASTE